MSNLPRTFCITLKETPARTRAFRESSSNSGLKIEYFHGIFGSKCGLAAKHPNVLESPDSHIFLTEGAIGCMLSHYTLWRVLQYQPEEEFFVVEDDAILEEGFAEKFKEIYSRLPSDWELVYVGWIPYGHDKTPIVVDTGISIRLPSATHAYLVKKSALDKLCQAILPMQSPLDLTFIHRVLPALRYYVFDPALVKQQSYLNTTDPVWTSLVYDWENDLYGCKKDLLLDFEFKEGWYLAERNDSDVWRWSNSTFKLKLPKGVDTLDLICSTPIENSVTIEGETFPLKVGDNVLKVKVGNTEITGTTGVPFIPSKHSSTSLDHRSLGICLKRLNLRVGETNIPIEITDKAAPLPALSFKL